MTLSDLNSAVSFMKANDDNNTLKGVTWLEVTTITDARGLKKALELLQSELRSLPKLRSGDEQEAKTKA